MTKRVLYIQYTDPAGYPPLEHSAHLVANKGWEVLFVGIQSYGVRYRMRPHDRIRIIRAGGRSGGPLGALKYAAFAARASAIARRFKPTWIYASDALSAPAALLAAKVTGARIIYHEHDIAAQPLNARNRMMMRARDRLIRLADLLVVPSAGRCRSLGSAGERAIIVWNCPLPDEIAASPPPARSDVTLVYAGSIAPNTLSGAVVRALALLPSHVKLHIVGYETQGSPNYVEELLSIASASGVRDRVMYRGAHERRRLLEGELPACDIGIATINTASDNESLRTMAGASNKAFDYMARGLPILVSDDPQWREMYVEPGYGVACDPADPVSIARAITPLLDPDVRAAMGQRAIVRVREEWNYTREFAPVLDAMTS